MQGATDNDAPHIADNTEPDAVAIDRDEALAKAVELAPLFASLAQVARAVNDALGLEWSAGAWRGLWVRNPEVAERVRKKLGTASRRNIDESSCDESSL